MENNIHKRIGAHLKHERIEKQKKAQDEAATEFYMDLKTWQRYEQGITPIPIELVVALSEKWGTDPNWLLLDKSFDTYSGRSPRRQSVHKGATYGPKSEFERVKRR